MSYYEDQEDAWMANDCKGSPSDYDPYDADAPWNQVKVHPAPSNKVHSAMGRSRCLLALHKLEEFAAWAVADGFVREPTKGFYEVLRLRWGQLVDGRRMQPYIFFKRDGAKHATTQSEGTQLVARWLRSRKS